MVGKRWHLLTAKIYIPLSALDGEGTWLLLHMGEGWGEVMDISFSRSQPQPTSRHAEHRMAARCSGSLVVGDLVEGSLDFH